MRLWKIRYADIAQGNTAVKKLQNVLTDRRVKNPIITAMTVSGWADYNFY